MIPLSSESNQSSTQNARGLQKGNQLTTTTTLSGNEKLQNPSSAEATTASMTGSSGSTTSNNTAWVRVIYIGMPLQATGTSSENLMVPSGTLLNDLIAQIETAHPELLAMGPTMRVLLNGMAPYGNPAIRDGDELDFIPFSAGG
jgi:molybdopterin converting factor small subunit